MQVGGEDLAIGADSAITTAIGQLHGRLLQGRPCGDTGMNFITGNRYCFKVQRAGHIAQLLLGFEHRGVVEQAKPRA
ncbi:hypothetical protein D3C81_1475170 [compost metagenome]